MARAKADLRAAAQRIRRANGELAAWRAGNIDSSDSRWRYGQLLDHTERTGDVPRYDHNVQTNAVTRAGGSSALMASLHLTYHEIAAAAVLLICLTGQNLGTLTMATVAHHRADAGDGGIATAQVELVKPRRGSRTAHMNVAWRDVGPGGERDELNTPFGIYTLLIELGQATRRHLGTGRLLVYFAQYSKTGRGFCAGVPRSSIRAWAVRAGLRTDPRDDLDTTTEQLPLECRRLRLTWLELHQRPVAHTEQTLANEYLARNRGNITEYQKLVAAVLGEQVQHARSTRSIQVLTDAEVAAVATNPAPVAAAHGITIETAQDLVAGNLDTVMAGCVDNLNSPYAPAATPCTASFLMCLSCPCARATPAHLPVQVLVHDALLARRPQMTPLAWATQYAIAVTQLAEVIDWYGPAAATDARQRATSADHDMVGRFLNQGLDLR